MFNQVIFRNAAEQNWLQFSNLVECFDIYRLKDVLPTLKALEARVEHGHLFAAGFISYESAPAFDPACEVKFDAGFPLLRFGLFKSMQTLDSLDQAQTVVDLSWQMDSVPPYYRSKIESIKDRIHAGDTYQVNYTVRQHSKGVDSPWSLFHQLGADTPHAAYIECDDWAVCSASPELFFELDGEQLHSRPMKGTAPRGATLREDEQHKSWLRNSEKNRAENVMIVDMIRNDMGRVATPGSVAVENLFRVETYPTVLQMTTSVTARTDASISEILRALFPCASITGAPKVNTMRIIAGLEDSPRRVYTGSLGYILPGRKAYFNVAIRTALVNRRNGDVYYGVGGGIVWDSVAGEELAEIHTKSCILGSSDNRHYFQLLESLLWTGSDFFLLPEHRTRVFKSARHFGIALRDASLDRHLDELRTRLPNKPCKVRVLVNHKGLIQSESSKLTDAQAGCKRVKVAPYPIDASSTWLAHKTTVRALYNEMRTLAGSAGDVLLWNQYGQLTESSVANVAVKLDGAWFTPRLACGLLAGTFRASELASGSLTEADIAKEQLDQAEGIRLLNSVREWIDVSVD